MPDIEGSLKEIDYALGTLKSEGIGLLTSYRGKYLGDPLFAAILDELNRRKTVIFTHPVVADCCRNLVPNVGDPVIEVGEDTARTILSLVFSGAARRYPDIKFIFYMRAVHCRRWFTESNGGRIFEKTLPIDFQTALERNSRNFTTTRPNPDSLLRSRR